MRGNLNNIVIYDGLCKLCCNSIRFLKKIDKKQKLQYLPYQSNETLDNLPESESNLLYRDSLLLLTSGRMYFKSSAIIHIFNQIGGIWKIMILLRLIPLVFRDWIYDFIAKHRILFFGKCENLNCNY